MLQKDVADFVRLIFDEDTILNSLKELDLDTKKMPLGKMSKATLARGIKVFPIPSPSPHPKPKTSNLTRTFVSVNNKP